MVTSLIEYVDSVNTTITQLFPFSLLFPQFYKFNSNPYAWDESSSDAGSEGALGLDFEFDFDSPVEVQNLTKEISIILSNGKTKLEPTELVFWNTSVHHKVEVTSNDTDLRLIIKPSYSSNLTVLVKYGIKATQTEHDFAYEIPRNLAEDENWDDEMIMDEARYTVLVPSSNGSGAGLYYITILLPGKKVNISNIMIVKGYFRPIYYRMSYGIKRIINNEVANCSIQIYT